MKVIATRQNDAGTFDKVGMNNRWLITDLKTERGVVNRIKRTGWAKGRAIRLEFFSDDEFYKEPKRVAFYTGACFPC